MLIVWVVSASFASWLVGYVMGWVVGQRGAYRETLQAVELLETKVPDDVRLEPLSVFRFDDDETGRCPACGSPDCSGCN